MHIGKKQKRLVRKLMAGEISGTTTTETHAILTRQALTTIDPIIIEMTPTTKKENDFRMRTIVLSTDQYTSGANVTRINMVTISGPAVPHHPTHHITRATHLIGRMDPDHTSQLHPHKSISIKEIQNREAICPPQVTLILKVVTPLTEAATTRIILQEKIIMSVTIQTIKQ